MDAIELARRCARYYTFPFEHIFTDIHIYTWYTEYMHWYTRMKWFSTSSFQFENQLIYSASIKYNSILISTTCPSTKINYWSSIINGVISWISCWHHTCITLYRDSWVRAWSALDALFDILKYDNDVHDIILSRLNTFCTDIRTYVYIHRIYAWIHIL